MATDLQKGEPLYEIVATGNAVIVTDAVAVCAVHPAIAAMV